ncbi:hypothetical protein WJ0W_007131 [Paenibacillus melissococcoides]|uniref:Uncharacterized protein n=1 Tax=Paenibacillus melissococcoides TaxID=2912268 RepID=A0ABM9G9K9_9BACL|nr:hypothetical protein [Paenibacillus melissococcoides]CAH8248463.1 hypothetical protein WJ0W_007131 [Paenibacillus melissococcoides]CAH8722130.1 hypothetical protein HTL2_006709 [Paenibacillus melissococcoides]CAH8722145.1 hypothetical protein WDD9_006648 [Paenibacillus melissococcoides]
MTERKRKPKDYGDSTSITISRSYEDWLTGERREVTEQHLELLNMALERKALFHLVMSGLDRVMDGLPPTPLLRKDLERQLNMGINFMKSQLSNYITEQMKKEAGRGE